VLDDALTVGEVDFLPQLQANVLNRDASKRQLDVGLVHLHGPDFAIKGVAALSESEVLPDEGLVEVLGLDPVLVDCSAWIDHLSPSSMDMRS
jgi:hypothetical protein